MRIRPPVISGSHTLQHPNRNKHDMMTAAQFQQQQQNLRQMGTHTLGRMPSHMSPKHGKSASIQQNTLPLYPIIGE